MTRGTKLEPLDLLDARGRRSAPVLARWRRELGWTQQELANRAGISRGYLSRLERGQPGRPAWTCSVASAARWVTIQPICSAQLGSACRATSLSMKSPRAFTTRNCCSICAVCPNSTHAIAPCYGRCCAPSSSASRRCGPRFTDARQLGLPVVAPLRPQALDSARDTHQFSPAVSEWRRITDKQLTNR